ncbi:hypothetical protein O7626_17825 [Micromonospora sp. WMMD1102]|uniref:hypothetical protein n=1 Tax=Micromonospora sp. WMMD1102 TaxID=3016105 RepID=UPI0024156069|nr:hypothetical protein [Micromonospora sp. WMMD1102]MDG4787774.1 hypothetical protein [Micromonospora sp. WMMD1102]
MSNRTKLRPGSRVSTPATTRPAGRRLAALALAFTLGALLAGPIGAVTAGDDPPMADEVAQLRAEEAKRDATQIVDLTNQARQVQQSLVPVLDGLAAAVPVGSGSGPLAAPAAVTGWQASTDKAVEGFADPPSAGTGVNIARSGLAAAVRALDVAVDTYAAALAVPAADRPQLLELVGRQRDVAVATWSTAATQLDLLNVDAGNGHTHVFLPAVPGQGALTADGAPEGR